MTRLGFSRRLALRGADLARWPENERAAALRLLRRSKAARRRYIAALDDDTGIGVQSASLDPALTARLIAGSRRGIADAAHRSRRAPWVRLPVPAMQWGALAACAVFGVWVGWTASVAAPPVTLLASVQLTPMSDPSP